MPIPALICTDNLSQLWSTQIQSRLSVIEHESGTLESSYQNLTSIQEMVESLVIGLSISRDDEELLLHHSHEVFIVQQRRNLMWYL